jgi:prevent-host-death family protein
METAVSAAEANRNFSQLLRGVRRGCRYLVTSHGQPVARILPADEADRAEFGARDLLFVRLRRQPESFIGSWTRDELYDEDAR